MKKFQIVVKLWLLKIIDVFIFLTRYKTIWRLSKYKSRSLNEK